MATRHIVSGIWFQDGLQDGRGRLSIVIDAGRIYDSGLYDSPMVPREESRLKLSAGEFTGWGAGRAFAPDAADVARLGLTGEA